MSIFSLKLLGSKCIMLLHNNRCIYRTWIRACCTLLKVPYITNCPNFSVIFIAQLNALETFNAILQITTLLVRQVVTSYGILEWSVPCYKATSMSKVVTISGLWPLLYFEISCNDKHKSY